MKMKMKRHCMKFKGFHVNSERHIGMFDRPVTVAAMPCQPGFHDHPYHHHHHHHGIGRHGSPWAKFKAVGFHGHGFKKHHFHGHKFYKRMFHDHHGQCDQCRPGNNDYHGLSEPRNHDRHVQCEPRNHDHHGQCQPRSHDRHVQCQPRNHDHHGQWGPRKHDNHKHGQHGHGYHRAHGHFCCLCQHEHRQDAESNQGTDAPQISNEAPAPNTNAPENASEAPAPAPNGGDAEPSASKE